MSSSLTSGTTSASRTPVTPVAVLQLPSVVHRVLRSAADEETERPAARRAVLGVVLADRANVALAKVSELLRRQPHPVLLADGHLAPEVVSFRRVDVPEDLVPFTPASTWTMGERRIGSASDRIVEVRPCRTHDADPPLELVIGRAGPPR